MHNKFMNERKLAYNQSENICFDVDFIAMENDIL